MADIGVHRPGVWSNARVKVIARSAKAVPTPEVVGVAVQGVGSALGYNIDDRAGVAAEFRVKVVCDDTELLCRIRIRIQHSTLAAGHGRVVVVHTVEHEIVVAVASPVDGKATRVIIRDGGPRRKQYELIGVARNQGQTLHLLLLDQIADLRRLQIHRGAESLRSLPLSRSPRRASGLR